MSKYFLRWRFLVMFTLLIFLLYVLTGTGKLADSQIRGFILPDNAEFHSKGRMDFYICLYRVDEGYQAKDICPDFPIRMDSMEAEPILERHAALWWEGQIVDKQGLFLWPGEYLLYGSNNSEDGRTLIGPVQIGFRMKKFDLIDFYVYAK